MTITNQQIKSIQHFYCFSFVIAVALGIIGAQCNVEAVELTTNRHLSGRIMQTRTKNSEDCFRVFFATHSTLQTLYKIK